MGEGTGEHVIGDEGGSVDHTGLGCGVGTAVGCPVGSGDGWSVGRGDGCGVGIAVG